MGVRKLTFKIDIAYGFGKKWRLAWGGGSLVDYVNVFHG